MLIVRASGDERIVVSLRAELVSYRFNVLEISPHGAAQRAPLASLAETYDAQAALRAQPEKFAVEVWVAASEPQASRDELVTIEAGERPELLATRVTEAMRARGLRLPAPLEPVAGAEAPPQPSAAGPGLQPAAADAAPKPSASQPSAAGSSGSQAGEPKPAVPPASADATPKPKPTPPVEPTPTPKASAEQPPKPKARPPAPHVNPVAAAPAAEPAAPRDEPAAVSGEEEPATSRNALLYVELSPAGVFHPGSPHGLGPSFDVWADLRLQPYPTTSLSLFALVPLVQAPIGNDQGYANVRMLAIGGAADLHVPVDPFALSVGMGAAALFTSFDPHTDNVLNRVTNTPQRTMAFFLRAGGGYQLASALRLTARVLIGFAVPELQIMFLNQPVASWGRPLIVATLGLELALPWRR